MIYFVIVILSVLAFLLGFIIAKHIDVNEYFNTIASWNRFKIYEYLFMIWARIEINGGSVSAYLKKTNNNKVIVYGMNNLGRTLAEYLHKNNDLVYVIDRDNKITFRYYKVWHSIEELPAGNRDALVVITPLYHVGEISNALRQAGFENMIAIDELFQKTYIEYDI